MADRADRLLDLNGLGGDDAEIKIGQLHRIGSGSQLDCEFVASGNVQALAVQGAGVLLATHERPDLGNAREVRCVE